MPEAVVKDVDRKTGASVEPSHWLDATPSEQEWSRLTLSRNKRLAFETDIYFRESWADWCMIAGGTSCAERLGPLAMLNLKPDAIVGRRGHAVIDYLEINGFDLLAVARIRLGRHRSAALWRYNWNFATLDRVHLSTLMYAANDTLMLFLRDRNFDGRVPGSVRLSALKGPATGRKRSAHHLREVLRSPHRLINFVHVADEPADIVREVGILLQTRDRQALFKSAFDAAPGPMGDTYRSHVDALELRCPAHDLDLTASLDRLSEALSLDHASRERLERAARDGEKLRWDHYLRIADPANSCLASWDFFCVGCWVLADERPGFPDLLPSVEPAEWLRAGRPLQPRRLR